MIVIKVQGGRWDGLTLSLDLEKPPQQFSLSDDGIVVVNGEVHGTVKELEIK